MLKKLLFALIAIVAAFLAYVAVLPSGYAVSRTTTISAPPAAVFAHVEDFRKWQAWSPWAKRDPNAKATFEGPASGEGAVFKWSGNREVGEGSLRIVESRPGELVRIKLAFVEPFEDTADVDFAFKDDGGKTNVTWRITGAQGFVERAICTLMGINLDKMIGADYEQGLANLKAVVEKG